MRRCRRMPRQPPSKRHPWLGALPEVVIGGQTFKIATAGESEGCDGVVCANATTPLLMPDNLTGPCRDCGDMLQYRPYNPKRPPRLCIDCATVMMLKARG